MDRDEVCSRFLEAVPYDLYDFQEEALLAWFESDGGVLICAPTGMGKPLIAEAAVFEALHTRKRIYYTTPLIALTEQKFREMQNLAESWGFEPNDLARHQFVEPGRVVGLLIDDQQPALGLEDPPELRQGRRRGRFMVQNQRGHAQVDFPVRDTPMMYVDLSGCQIRAGVWSVVRPMPPWPSRLPKRGFFPIVRGVLVLIAFQSLQHDLI